MRLLGRHLMFFFFVLFLLVSQQQPCSPQTIIQFSSAYPSVGGVGSVNADSAKATITDTRQDKVHCLTQHFVTCFCVAVAFLAQSLLLFFVVLCASFSLHSPLQTFFFLLPSFPFCPRHCHNKRHQTRSGLQPMCCSLLFFMATHTHTKKERERERGERKKGDLVFSSFHLAVVCLLQFVAM